VRQAIIPRDRRTHALIYVVLFVVIALGLLFPSLIKNTPAAEATESYSLLGRAAEGRAVLLVYHGVAGDAQRQATAILRQALRQGAVVMTAASSETAAGEVDRILRAELARSGLSYGTAAVNLGYREGAAGPEFLLALTRDFYAAAGGRDHGGADLDLLPLTHTFRRLDEASLWSVVAGEATDAVVAAESISRDYPVPLLVAASGDAAALAGQLWQEGRIAGVLAGGKVTTDYEALVEGDGTASRRMTALSLGTLFIIALIVWAYLSGFITRRRRATLVGGISA